MKKLCTLVLCAGVAACSDQPTEPAAVAPSFSNHTAGNGFPAGGHDYHLNVIGVPKDKSVTLDDNNGHRIFVQLWSDNVVTNPGGKNNHLKKGGGDDQNQIFLCNSTNDEGDSTDPRCAAYGNPDTWGVIDANATDGDGALLAVPDPCAGNDSTDGCTPRYQIYARARAGGSATITTCGEEEEAFDDFQDTWCGSNGITLYPTKGRKAKNVSDNLLYMTITVDDTLDPELAACIDPDGDSTDGLPDSYDVYLFDRCFQNYFWNYDNNGLKNLELRFYWAPTAA
ncbi:MAG TPA: hypothetical protein VF212_17060 [Longimicrobiales bacterium]